LKFVRPDNQEIENLGEKNHRISKLKTIKQEENLSSVEPDEDDWLKMLMMLNSGRLVRN